MVGPLGKFDSTNQKHYLDLGSDPSSVWNFKRHLAGKLVVASPNVGCLLKLSCITLFYTLPTVVARLRHETS